MLFPDCRNDDCYNEDFLTEKDKEFLRGFDWCIEMAVDNYFDNHYETEPEEEPFDDDFTEITDEEIEAAECEEPDDELEWLLTRQIPTEDKETYTMEYKFGDREDEERTVTTYADHIRMNILYWIEMKRNELIVSMIESMNEEEYKANRQRVLEENKKKENPKEYYDTRHYVCTGKKITNEI